MPALSVVICSRNRPEKLARLLRSVREAGRARTANEIIICDDSDFDILSRIDPGLLDGVEFLPPAGKRQGYARNANRGLLRARGFYLTLPPLSDDVICLPGWDTEAIKALRGRDGIAQIAFTLLSPAGGQRWPSSLSPWPLYIPKGITTRAILEKVGLFDDEEFTTGGEDVDWSLRLKSLGLLCAVCSEARIIHDHDQQNAGEIDRGHREKLRRKWGSMFPV